MKSVQQLLGDPSIFLQNISDQLEAKKINVTDYELDHICYRVSSLDRYHELKKTLNEFGDLLIESKINGRAISTFRLNNSIGFKGREIWCLELPAPKSGSNYQEGFEHVEFVISEPLEDFLLRFPNIDFDLKGLSKKVNSDVRIKFGDLSVKFHRQSLEYVIKHLD